MNNELIGVIEDNSFNVIVQITESGARGLPGSDGKDGYTPIKGIDYFDGSDANVTNTNVVNALGYIPLSEDSLPSNLETTTGSQGKANQAESNAKSYVDGKVLTDVPSNAKFTDTVYSHPPTHPASMITQDTNNRFVSDSEKGVWNGKQDALGFTPVNTTDSRLSNARTPLTHTHTKSQITDMPTKLSQLIDDIGAGAGLVIITSATEPTLSVGDQWHREI